MMKLLQLLLRARVVQIDVLTRRKQLLVQTSVLIEPFKELCSLVLAFRRLDERFLFQ